MELNLLFIFLLVFLFYIIFDALWFTVFSYKNIYQPQFQLINQNKMKIRKTSAICTYFVLSLGLSLLIYFFYPITVQESFLLGVVYGFVVYGVYNGTNFSTLNQYKLKTVVVDSTWGMVVSGIISIMISLLS